MSGPTRDDLIDFVYEEARMLDDGRFDAWLDLWMPDGYYWMPLDYNQQDVKHVTSLLHEDFFHNTVAPRTPRGGPLYRMGFMAMPCISHGGFALGAAVGLWIATRPKASTPAALPENVVRFPRGRHA